MGQSGSECGWGGSRVGQGGSGRSRMCQSGLEWVRVARVRQLEWFRVDQGGVCIKGNLPYSEVTVKPSRFCGSVIVLYNTLGPS